MRPNNNNKRKPPVTKTVSFIASGKDQFNNDYDADSAKQIMADLSDANAFEKLSVMAMLSKKVAFDKEDAKGSIPVARISSYNKDNGEIDLTFFGNNTDYANVFENMAIVPRVRTNRDSDEVTTILGFDIVDMMGA